MLAAIVAILCSLGFLAIGVYLGRWHEQDLIRPFWKRASATAGLFCARKDG